MESQDTQEQTGNPRRKTSTNDSSNTVSETELQLRRKELVEAALKALEALKHKYTGIERKRIDYQIKQAKRTLELSNRGSSIDCST